VLRFSQLMHFCIALVLNEHACLPLDREIERIEFLLASCASRRRQEEAHR
jgi:hypothetical protein